MGVDLRDKVLDSLKSLFEEAEEKCMDFATDYMGLRFICGLPHNGNWCLRW